MMAKLGAQDDTQCYLSPRLFEALGRQSLKANHFLYKSEVWAIGLIMLQAATLDQGPTHGLYDWKLFRVDEAKLEEKLALVNPGYSKKFRDMLSYHLILDEKKRPNPNDLLVTDFFKYIRVDTDNSFAIVNLDLVIGHED